MVIKGAGCWLMVFGVPVPGRAPKQPGERSERGAARGAKRPQGALDLREDFLHASTFVGAQRRTVGFVLARFIYLDTVALGQYLAALEGGLLSESTRRSRRSGTGGGGVDAKVVQARGERTSEEESRTVADTDAARFARLLEAADDDPEALG